MLFLVLNVFVAYNANSRLLQAKESFCNPCFAPPCASNPCGDFEKCIDLSCGSRECPDIAANTCGCAKCIEI